MSDNWQVSTERVDVVPSRLLKTRDGLSRGLDHLGRGDVGDHSWFVWVICHLEALARRFSLADFLLRRRRAVRPSLANETRHDLCSTEAGVV